MNRIFIFMFMIVSFFACNDTEMFNESNELKIIANIEQLRTRASETSFDVGDVINIYYISQCSRDTTIPNIQYFSSTTATYNGNDWILSTPVYHPMNYDTCLIICASYNYNLSDTIGSALGMFSKKDSINDFLLCEPFLCRDKYGYTRLQFEHQLSKLLVNVKDVDGIGINDLKIEFSNLAYGFYFYNFNVNTYLDTTLNCKLDYPYINNIVIPEQTLDTLIIQVNGMHNLVSLKDVVTKNKQTTYLNLNIKGNSV